MTSTLPSGPKPTKETYLAALRILKEHHQNAEEEHQLVRNSPNKAMAGKSVLCGEEIVLAKPPGENTATSLLKTAKTVAPKEPTKSTKMPTKEPEAQMSAKVVKPSQASSKSVKMNPITQSSKRAHHISSEALKAEPKETIKLGSKATRRFTVVAGLLPNFRLDKSTKIKVAETLKELNCWSDDELAVEEEEEDNDSDSTDSEFEAKRAVPPPVPETTPAAVPLTAHNKSMKKTAPAGLIKSTVVSKTAGNNSSNKAHAYLQEQKEQAKRKAKEAMVKKAIKLFVRVRKEEMDAHCKQQWATNGKHAVERAMIARVAAARWDRILRQAMPVAVDRFANVIENKIILRANIVFACTLLSFEPVCLFFFVLCVSCIVAHCCDIRTFYFVATQAREA